MAHTAFHDREIELIRDLGSVSVLTAGQVLFRTGEALDSLFVVTRGSLMLSVGNRMNGRSHRAHAPSGTVFGPAIAGRRQAAPFTARAVEEAEVIRVDPGSLARLGAADVGLSSRLVVECHETQRRLAEELGSVATQGRIVPVWGPKSGVGATSTCLVLAALSRELDMRTLVLDLHPFLGDAAAQVDVKASGDLVSLLRDDVTVADLERVAKTGLGFDLVAAPSRIEDGQQLSFAALEPLLRLAAEAYDLVLLDLPDGLDDLVVSCLEVADSTVAVAGADFMGLLALRRCLETLGRMEVGLETMTVVMNRHRSESGLAPDQIRHSLGRPLLLLPEDRGDLIGASNSGRMAGFPVEHRDHPMVTGLAEMAQVLSGLRPREHLVEIMETSVGLGRLQLVQKVAPEVVKAAGSGLGLLGLLAW